MYAAPQHDGCRDDLSAQSRSGRRPDDRDRGPGRRDTERQGGAGVAVAGKVAAGQGGLGEYGGVVTRPDEVRQFGQRMVDDHSKANQDLMQVASGKGWALPTALDAKAQGDVQKLSALSGDKFDKTYVDMMVKDHRKDTAEFQKESKSGKDADVKSWASTTLPTLQDHLKMAQETSSKLHGGSKKTGK